MGSFAFTCAISNLPIHVGDAVRWLPLMGNPYVENRANVCELHGAWAPRGWAIRAKYNDYGSIEDYDKAAPASRAFSAILDMDLWQKGAGSNQYHEPPTKRGMSFESALDALGEGRLMVLPSVPFPLTHLDMEGTKKELSEVTAEPDIEGWPSLTSVTRALTKAKLKVYDPDQKAGLDAKGYYRVDRRGPGWMVVRASGYGDRLTPLHKVVAALKEEFAVILTDGSQSSFSAEVQVMPHPETADDAKDAKRNAQRGSFLFQTRSDKHPLYIQQAMVREDVWNALADLPYRDYDYNVKPLVERQFTRAEARKDVQDAWERDLAAVKNPKGRPSFMMLDWHMGRESLAAHLMHKSVIPFTMGLAQHYQWVLQQHVKVPFPEQAITEFLDDIAAYAQITRHLMSTRYWWRPSYSCGPQFGDWSTHAIVNNIFADLAHKQYVKEVEEQARWDAEMAADDDTDEAEPDKTDPAGAKCNALNGECINHGMCNAEGRCAYPEGPDEAPAGTES